MLNTYSAQEILEFISENDGNVGCCLGITEIKYLSKNWSFGLYIGNERLIQLYDRKTGINESAFNEILSMKKIHKQALKNNTWKMNHLKHFSYFSENDFNFVCYDFNIIDISNAQNMDTKNLVRILKSNLSEIHKLKEGDVITFDRNLYSHHAILADESYMTVIHKWGEPENSTSFGIASKSIIGIPTTKAKVSEDFVIEVAGFRSLSKGNHIYDSKHTPMKKEEILKNCRSSLGEPGYSVLNDNCQNFVSLKRNGVSRSPEIEMIQNVLVGFAIFSVSALSALWFKKKINRNSEK